MNAAEIRELAGRQTNAALLEVLLGEIAAQLADLNEHFRQVDEAVFGTPQHKIKKPEIPQ